MAIYLALSHFSSRLRGQSILIRTDNSTCISYLKRQGGTKVPRLIYITWKLFHLCMDYNIQLVAVHLAGKLNSLVDQLSRATRPVATEWALNSHVFRAVARKWGEPGIDLFTTRLNKQLLVYVSPCPDPQAFDTDALSMDWDILPFPSLFPPSPILPVVLPKVKQSDNTFLVIALLWPHQTGYPNLISLSVDHPLCLPQREDLLVQDLPKRFWIHPNPGMFQYHAWLLSGSTSKQQVFPASTVDRIALPQRDSTGCLYNAKWEFFCRWCHRRKADPVSTDVPLVEDFLEHLFQRMPPVTIDTIRGYRSALSSTLYNVVDLTNSVFLRNLFKNRDLQRPKYKQLCPKWNLALVLGYITSPTFNPIMKASLWHLTLKTVFLLKLASRRRRNELHALSCDEKCYRFRADGGQVSLITEPGFLGKNQKRQDSGLR